MDLGQYRVLPEGAPAVMLPSYRHLLSFMKFFTRFSRDETPVGSLHPFRLGISPFGDPIYPITG
jgi:hypothetical protein